ncbi:tRNA-dihydrouridine(20/20a) synthase [Polynucleobacter sp. SHI8]|uniref:tRNA dihydrouridine(20/20a) synthase DusA n=1 Tax=unclassified Polynucleobacter TaxID=2640945 RepID=UPI0024939730|nr:MULTISPECIES: tRNA dihydrouridine(20/20a) synthase DusA [unclassified Polynucleobacter]BDW11230.1 tRNA-dihydrouridine(20/20a) synthase [Polynucleobacter sp. SHI2]BDW13676.1 tRNA-dihydrouridine(20/20a) synthase [Polynucleobacter sp. SHI8]
MNQDNSGKILAVAPMMDWTDRHCRSFHRILTKKTHLYTEMINTGAIIYGDVHRHLDFDTREHYVVLQLGGSDPSDLAIAAKKAQDWGYDQIDLNCGCPSERVQKGSFGACLMSEPSLVADCVKAMKDAVSIPVSVKHRLGLDDMDPRTDKDYQFVLDFMAGVAQAGASQLTIHARNAVLKGLSPKENRTIPPLRYDVAERLRQDLQQHFPSTKVLLNGGLEQNQLIANHWHDFDGCMVGRAAYHTPAMMLGWDRMLESEGHEFGYFLNDQTWLEIQSAIIEYAQAWLTQCQNSGESFYIAAITRHILGLAHGLGGARLWRQHMSDHRILSTIKTHQDIENFFTRASRELRIFSDEQEEDRLSPLDES